MRILIKDPLGELPLNGMPGLRALLLGGLWINVLIPSFQIKYLDPTPEFWGEELKEN